MAIIYSYPSTGGILGMDTLIGTASSNNQTKSFMLSSISSYVIGNIPRGTLTTNSDTNVTLTLTGVPANSLFKDVAINVGWDGLLANNRIASASLWNTAYADKINSATVTGTVTKLLTLNQQDGSTITASWYDAGSEFALTTNGVSGLATLTGNILNIPNYTPSPDAFVSYVNALSIGSTGNDISSTVANPTTEPTITLNIPTASATKRGVLSSSDWSTFNEKQIAGNYITELTGEATALGPNAASVTLNNSAVTAKVLSGVNITGGSVEASDTILSAFGKLQNQINALATGSAYRGTWNAATNTPTIESGVGTKGYYYITSVAGNTNIDGTTGWAVGDWIIFDGTLWEKVENADAVTSVNGEVGAVDLITDDIDEGTTNLYYTEARVNANANVSANTAARHAAVTIGTNNGLSLSGQQLSLSLASSTANGALSAGDWVNFNNKQTVLDGTGFIKATGTVISYDNNTYALDSSVVKLTGDQTVAGVKTFSSSITATGFKTPAGNSSQILVANGTIITAGTNITISGGTISAAASGVVSFNTRTGAVTLTSSDVTTALGYTPYNSTNPAGYTTNTGTVTSISGSGTVSGLTLTGTVTNSGSLTLGGTLTLTSANVTTALGYTPYNSTNPSGYITGINSSMVTTALGYTPYNSTNPNGYITGINGTMVTNALGYTPVSGSGTTNTIAKFTAGGSVGNSTITDDGTNVSLSGTITASGGFFNSDIRLKDIISRDNDVIHFKWKDKRDDKIHVGYVAQEVQEIMPDAVNVGADNILSVNYIEVLVAKIAKMEKEIELLKSK